MRFCLDALIKPLDPVVATHSSSRDADAAIALLKCAGYGNGMLSVVGQASEGVGLAGLEPNPSRNAPHWAASGTAVGLLWALFAIAVVFARPAGSGELVALVMMGLLTVALQTAVMAHLLPSGRGLPNDHVDATPPPTSSATPSWRFLVVVHGNRSEVALARDILAMR